MEEQAAKGERVKQKLARCQIFRPVGTGGGCELVVGEAVPKVGELKCHNCEGVLGAGASERLVSLSDLTSGGKYLVLWFFPEAPGSSGNGAEAVQFERLLADFAALDAVVVGCSSQSVAEQKRTLVAPRGLSYPFISDVGSRLADAFGASSDVGVGTLRQTFVIDPNGALRWQEVNIDFGIGEFSIENHPRRVLREFASVRNRDGWSV